MFTQVTYLRGLRQTLESALQSGTDAKVKMHMSTILSFSRVLRGAFSTPGRRFVFNLFRQVQRIKRNRGLYLVSFFGGMGAIFANNDWTISMVIPLKDIPQLLAQVKAVEALLTRDLVYLDTMKTGYQSP